MGILISPIVVPIVVTAIGMFYFYAQVGLASTLTGIILAHTALGVPFVVITVSATLAGFDHNMLRAGAILGGNPLRVFRKITLPIITPGVASGGLPMAMSMMSIPSRLLESLSELMVPKR